MENNGEALLHDMINDGADEEDADYAQYDETQYDEALEGYSIDNQPLFGNNCFTYAMGEDGTQTLAEGIAQATAATLVASLILTVFDGKKVKG
jgi:hypothetical protein